MQIMGRAGILDRRMSQNHNINRCITSNKTSYQGETTTRMGKTNQKSDGGKKKAASDDRVRGAEKSPALNLGGSTVRGSFREVKRKTSMTMARNKHNITNISLLELGGG